MGGGIMEIRAQVPQAELLRYSIDLRSITSGTGSFEVEFDHYSPVTGRIADDDHQRSEGHAGGLSRSPQPTPRRRDACAPPAHRSQIKKAAADTAAFFTLRPVSGRPAFRYVAVAATDAVFRFSSGM